MIFRPILFSSDVFATDFEPHEVYTFKYTEPGTSMSQNKRHTGGFLRNPVTSTVDKNTSSSTYQRVVAILCTSWSSIKVKRALNVKDLNIKHFPTCFLLFTLKMNNNMNRKQILSESLQRSKHRSNNVESWKCWSNPNYIICAICSHLLTPHQLSISEAQS
jgi:hypothetical protein